MSRKKTIYAIVSQCKCCVGWERSFQTLPYEIDGERQLPNDEIVKNDNIEDRMDWDSVFSGDWTYRLFTAEQAIEAIQKESYWFGRYRSERIDDIESFSLTGFADEKPIVFGFDNFLEYIEDCADNYSLEWCLAEIILKEKRKEEK